MPGRWGFPPNVIKVLHGSAGAPTMLDEPDGACGPSAAGATGPQSRTVGQRQCRAAAQERERVNRRASVQVEAGQVCGAARLRSAVRDAFAGVLTVVALGTAAHPAPAAAPAAPA